MAQKIKIFHQTFPGSDFEGPERLEQSINGWLEDGTKEILERQSHVRMHTYLPEDTGPQHMEVVVMVWYRD